MKPFFLSKIYSFRLFSSSKNLPILPTSNPFKKSLQNCYKTAFEDLKALKWDFNIIRINGIPVELEFQKKYADSTVTIKAGIAPFKNDLEKQEMDLTKIQTQTEYIEQITDPEEKKAEEDDLQEMVEEVDNSEDYLAVSDFILGITRKDDLKSFVAECNSEDGVLSIEHSFITDKSVLVPKFDGNKFIDRYDLEKEYVGPKVNFLKDSIQLFFSELLVEHGVDSELVPLIEFLSSVSYFEAREKLNDLVLEIHNNQ